MPMSTGASTKRISLVIPVYCEEEVIPEFHRRAKGALLSLGPRFTHEKIFVNDGSTDPALALLPELAAPDACPPSLDLCRHFRPPKGITARHRPAPGGAG